MYICIIHRWLFLIFHRFHIYEFTYVLKLICNPKVNTDSIFVVLHRHEHF